MTTVGSLVVRIAADPSSLKQGVGQSVRSIGQLESVAKRATVALGGLFAVRQIQRFGADVVRAAAAGESSLKRLEAMWQANAGAVGRSLEELRSFTREMRDTTLFKSDEIELAAAQLLSYKSIAGETFERTIRLGADLASVFGGLSQSTAALARALDDPIRGLGDLRRAGFTFEDSVISQVQSLVQQNRLFEAQKILLGELEAEAGGVATAMRSGMTGALKTLSDAWDDLREAIGNALLTAADGPSITDRLAGHIKSLTEWTNRNAHRFAAAADWARRFFRALSDLSPVSLRTGVLIAGVGVASLKAVTALSALAGTVTVLRGAVVALQAKAALGGLLTLLHPAGLLIAGVGATVGLMVTLRRRMQELRGEAEEFARTAASMTRQQLIQTTAALEARITELHAARAALAGQERTATPEHLPRIHIELGKIDAEVMRLERQQRVVAKQFNEMGGAARTFGRRAADGVESVIDSLESLGDALDREIALLERGRELRILSGSEYGRMLEIETALNAALARGNLTLEQRVKTMERLQRVQTALPVARLAQGTAQAARVGGITIDAEAVRRVNEQMRRQAELTEALNLRLVEVPRAVLPTVSAFDRARYALDSFVRSLGQEAQWLAHSAGRFAGNLAGAAGAGEAGPKLAALAVAVEVLEPAFRSLAPAMQAFAAPLQAVGAVLGRMLVPVLRLTFPVIKFFGVMLTYVGQLLANIASVLSNAIGHAIRAIGQAIDKIPFVSGGPLIRAGESLIRFGEEASQTARDMVDARREIRNMDFDSALDSATESVRAFTSALSTVPRAFNLALARHEIGAGGAPPAPTPPSTPPMRTPHVEQHFEIRIDARDRSARELLDEVEREAARRYARGGTSRLALAV